MSKEFDQLAEIIAQLRAPDGCPWDRQQTHETLKPYLLEETYEVFDAIDAADPSLLREELGDVLLQIFLHAQMAKETGDFTIEDVVADLTKKLIRRHPHVFERTQRDTPTLSPEQVKTQWEAIKQQESSGSASRSSLLSGIPSSLPSLFRAWKIQSRASRAGFDWPTIEGVVEKLDEEIQELREVAQSLDASSESTEAAAAPSSSHDHLEGEFGDVLFTIANLARFLHINPEEALRKTTNRFVSRFHHMESLAASRQKNLQAVTDAEWDTWWEEAKLAERKDSSP